MDTNTHRYMTNGIPHSVTALTPYLALVGAAAAAEHYVEVFGARLLDATEIDGVVVHAELDFGQGRLQVGEPSSAFGTVGPPAGGACYSLGLYCADVDAVVARAVAGGATVREEPQDFVSGDRFASILDPFGVRWTIMTRIEDISDAESRARVAAWASARSQG